MSASGERTRAKLLDVATRLFSQHGFEAVSTRDIAGAAGATLPSIPHHFGSKEGLYRAVLAAIAEEMGKQFAPAAEVAAAFLAQPKASRAATLQVLEDLLEAQARVVLVNDRTDWTALVIQRHQQPPTLVGGLPRPFETNVLEPVTQLIARLREERPDSETAKLQALTLVGRPLMLRVALTPSLRFLGWQALTNEAIDSILAVMKSEVRLIFERRSSPRR